MLTPAIVNIVSFSYPIGNTPAVCLTQDLPFQQAAEILLLGCGDVRNILFTAYSEAVNSSRPIDITCCDVEKAILARNILLFSLVVDDVDDRHSMSIWDIYYHFYLDEKALNILLAQTAKLLIIAESLQSWRKSKYGSLLRFCDEGTFNLVQTQWRSYPATEISRDEKEKYRTQFESTIQKSLDARKRHFGSNPVTTGFRSAAPAGVQSLIDLPKLHQHFWDHGTTGAASASKHPNPMFATLLTDNYTLHYGTDPLLGFHIATAYIPLTPESPLRPNPVPLSSQATPKLHKVVEAARVQFREWGTAFRKCAHNKLILRFFAGEAIAFCYTLQHMRVCRGDASANWFRGPYQLIQLTLDGEDYKATGTAPTSFDVIDTSNLVDHVGAVNLLVAVSPLLKNGILACLYTESLVKKEEGHKQLMDGILCGHLPTMSILLGLVPVEYWTNVTAISNVEEDFHDAVSKLNESNTNEKSSQEQMYSRLAWRRPLESNGAVSTFHIYLDAMDLASVLHRVYQKMFQHENMQSLLASITQLSVIRASILHYHRGSFAALLHLIKTRVKVNWEAMMDNLLHLIENDSSIIMGRNYIQELYLQLHLFKVYSMPIFRPGFRLDKSSTVIGGLSTWSDMPPVVCITLSVPRSKLKLFTNMSLSEIGTPIVHCILQSGSQAVTGSWQNIFSDIQLAFGKITATGPRHSDDFRVEVTRDELGWSGTSPLIASFFAPSWVVTLEPQSSIIAFGVQSTPLSAHQFMKHLGPEMNVYSTNLMDEGHVFYTKYSPNQSRYAQVHDSQGAVAEEAQPSPATLISLTGVVDRDLSQIVALKGRIDIASEQVKKLLSNGAAVELKQVSALTLAIVIGKEGAEYQLHFPAPVIKSRTKTRIARKSSYVEVETPLADHTSGNGVPNFMYPLFVHGTDHVLWNMPRLAVEKLPIINIENRIDLQWVITHLSLQFSARERKLRDASVAAKSQSNGDVRVNFKDSLFSIFIRFTGLQGKSASIFGINHPAHGGIHILVFVSCLRLDIANRTVVLDCAVLPLQDHLMPKLRPLIQSLFGSGICSINVDDEELRLWREILPTFVERCRQWTHLDTCEYTATSKIPLSLENGQPLLCTCGAGTLPKAFYRIQHSYIIEKYAVRAAISPSFSVPYVESSFEPDYTILGDRCRNCLKGKSSEGGNLLRCAQCYSAKYCSASCQRVDWKLHKSSCKSVRKTTG